ncbi:hypothetical protein ACFRDV_22275 [Streptomyces fagopyri]|uniref:hypothetical protein n=1 Tax=Streptomyces fagopyri TaxID=2662397 RepID=UPI00368AA493
MGLAIAAVAMVFAAVGCSSDSDGGGDDSVAYGARSCADWAGGMSDADRWDAAKELLAQVKASDGTKGDKAPATSVLKQFEQDMGTACDRGASDDLLATVADGLYETNRAFYTL